MLFQGTLPKLDTQNLCRHVPSNLQNHHVAQIYRLQPKACEASSLSLIAEPWHPQHIRRLAWLGNDNHKTLCTESTNGIVRLWRTLADEPDFFTLWATVASSTGTNVANIWLRTEEAQPYTLLSLASDGTCSLAIISVSTVSHALSQWHTDNEQQNLHASSTAASIKQLTLAGKPFSRQTLGCLRYNLNVPTKGSHYKICGRSLQQSIVLLDLDISESPTTMKTLRNKVARKLPTQHINRMAVTSSGTHLASTGPGSEINLWQAKRAGTQVASVSVKASFSPSTATEIDHLAISPSGQEIFYLGQHDSALLRYRDRKLIEELQDPPQLPPAKSVLAIAFACSVTGDLHFIVIDDRCQIFIWSIPPTGEPVLLHVSEKSSESVRLANIAPSEAATGLLHAAAIDNNGLLRAFTITLNSESSTSREEESISTGQQAATHLACAASNFVAIGAVLDTLCLRSTLMCL